MSPVLVLILAMAAVACTGSKPTAQRASDAAALTETDTGRDDAPHKLEPTAVKSRADHFGEDEVAFDNTTAGAVPGEQLVPFTPSSLGGVARTHLLDYPFSTAAVYELGGGEYLNLDIKNTFRRATGSDAEEMFTKNCKQAENVGGFKACARIDAGRASLHWYLPDRLSIDLAAPDEAALRKAAEHLPLAALAKLSAAK